MPTRPFRPALALCAGLAVVGLARAQSPVPLPPLPPPPAVHRTANFRVEAADPDTAKLIAEKAEHHRAALATRWFGKDLPAWPKPATVRANVGLHAPGGGSWFTFDRGAVATVDMALDGPLDVILSGVLPHELTHGVLTTHFGRPVPRWADEGLAILAEAADIQAETADNFRDFRTRGRCIRVKTLFELTDYPPDVFCVYLQGHSLVRFLVDRGQGADELARRKALLAFLDAGGRDGWDAAAKRVYGFESVDALETAWGDWVAATGQK